jgi:nucleoside-diphosphate-sugar epimerase
MRIFLTGGTGYVGGAILDALLRSGHDVTALVRNNEKARSVAKRGGHPVVGNLAEPESFRGAAEAQDGYIHAAYDARSGRGPAIDQAALETIVAAAKRPRTAGSNATAKRFIIYTSGCGSSVGNRSRPTSPRRSIDRAGVVPAGARTARPRRGQRFAAHVVCGPASSTAAATAWSATSSSPPRTVWSASSATATTTGRSSTIAISRSLRAAGRT